MKKTTIVILLTFFLAGGIFAEENYTEYTETALQEDDSGRLFVVFNEGTAVSWLTRIINQSQRSNFVFEDFLIGLYLLSELHNLKYITPAARLAVYYPLTTTFNGFPQYPNNPVQFGIDFNLGTKFQIYDFEFIRLYAMPALHTLYLTSDRWNYFNIGGSIFAGCEVPLNGKYTLLFNGSASLDNGNLGGNRNMEPFDIAYQYQIDLGVRYSKKLQNKTGLINSLFGGKTNNENLIINR